MNCDPSTIELKIGQNDDRPSGAEGLPAGQERHKQIISCRDREVDWHARARNPAKRGALTEEDANELAARISAEMPGGTVGVEPMMDVPSPLFVLVRSWL